MIKSKNVKMIEVSDWNNFVSETYGRIYSFQQQDGCQSRCTVNITIPSEWTSDEEMNESIPEEVNGEEMGVKFAVWLARDPKQPLSSKKGERSDDFGISLFWGRNFYPDLHTVANDLHAKGLIEAGDYAIEIDW